MSDYTRRMELAVEALGQGRAERTVRLLEPLLGDHAHDGQVHHLFVAAQMKCGDFAAACQTGADALARVRDEWRPQLLLLTADAMVLQGHFERAAALYLELPTTPGIPARGPPERWVDRASRLRAGEGPAIRRAAYAARKLAPPPLPDEDADAVQASSASAPEDRAQARLKALVDEARVRGQAGHPDQALDPLERALLIAPDNGWLRCRVIEVLLMLGDSGSARDVAASGPEAKHPELLALSADALVMDVDADIEGARRLYRHALEGAQPPLKTEVERRLAMLPDRVGDLRTELWGPPERRPAPALWPYHDPGSTSAVLVGQRKRRVPPDYGETARAWSKGEGAEWDVFVSYRSTDSDAVRGMVEWLELAGLRVWFAEQCILPDRYDRFHQAIREGIESSASGLVFWTEGFETSLHCRQEVSWLVQRFLGDPGRLLRVSAAPGPRPPPVFNLVNDLETTAGWRLRVLDHLARVLGRRLEPPEQPVPIAADPFALPPADGDLGFDKSGLSVRSIERHAVDGTAIVELAGEDTALHVSFDYAIPDYSPRRPGADPDVEDRRLLRLRLRLAARFNNALQAVGIPLEMRGVHLVWDRGGAHPAPAVTYRLHGWWHRVAVVHLADKAGDRIGLVAVLSVRGDRAAFLRRAPVLERMVRTLEVRGALPAPPFAGVRGGLVKRPMVILERAAAEQPRAGEVHHMLAAGRLQAWQPELAAAAARRGLAALDGGDRWAPRIRAVLADALIILGEWDEARRVLSEVGTRPQDAPEPLRERTLFTLFALEEGYGSALRTGYFEVQGLPVPALPSPQAARPKPMSAGDRQRLESRVQRHLRGSMHDDWTLDPAEPELFADEEPTPTAAGRGLWLLLGLLAAGLAWFLLRG